MKQVTKDVLDMLLKASEDNTAGGGFADKQGSFRCLFEPPKGDNTKSGLIETLNRSELEAEWLQQYKSANVAPYERMKLAVEHDFVCQLHRDIQHRYSGRIGRMLAENARKEYYAKKPSGGIIQIERRIDSFSQLTPE